MFEIKITDPRILNNSLGVIADFITEATFNVSKEGIRLTAMDPANISMVILNLLPSAFTSYTIKQDQEITLNLDNFRQALKRAKPGEVVNLSLDKNKLKLEIVGKSVKRFLIPLLEKEGKEKKAPSLEFNAVVELDANEFKEYIEDSSVVGDALTMSAEKDTLMLEAGDSGSKVHIELKKDKGSIKAMTLKNPARAIYSVEYLKKMAKSSTLADVVNVQFSNDYPLRLDFKSVDKAQISFILAPRIENK